MDDMQPLPSQALFQPLPQQQQQGATPNTLRACQIQFINRTGNTTLYAINGWDIQAPARPLAPGQTATFQSGREAYVTQAIATIANLPTASHPEGAGMGLHAEVRLTNDWSSTPWTDVRMTNQSPDQSVQGLSVSKYLSEGECIDVQGKGSAFRQMHVCRQGDTDEAKVLTVEVYSA